MLLEKRSVAAVILWSIFTCGFYLLYWYYKVYEEIKFFTGKSPTDNEYALDLLLTIVTCGIWGIYVDYKISLVLYEYQKNHGMMASDTSMIAVLLDVMGYLTGYFTGIVSSAIHQDLMNGLIDRATGRGGAPMGGPQTGGPPSTDPGAPPNPSVAPIRPESEKRPSGPSQSSPWQ